MNQSDNRQETVRDARILVADDDKDVIEEIQDWLKIYGYQEVQIARSASECIQILGNDDDHFDVIIADMRMEHSDSGFAILEHVKQETITSAVVIFTANDTTQDCRRAFRGGAWDYISKNWPGNMFDLLHQSMQDALAYYTRWSHRDNEVWIRENREELRIEHAGKYIAVLNQSVLEIATSHTEIYRYLEERKLPRYLTAIEYMEPVMPSLVADLTVLVEGPTDVKYLHAAAKILGEETLLERVRIDTIGDTTGRKGSGFKALNQGFTFLMNNPLLHPNPVLFLFDQDVKPGQLPNQGQDHETLYIRQVDGYSEDDKGIEYLLSKQILEDGFEQEFIEIDLGRATARQRRPTERYIIKEQKKMALCNWVCNVRQNEANDFAQFQRLFDMFRQLLPDEVKKKIN
ncbi:MAG: response regulator [Chloroflexota bacterium]